MTCRSLGLLCLCLCWTVLFAQQQNDVNVALGKNYSQINKHSDSDKPSQGANGDTNYYYYFGVNCIHTIANTDNPWWQVDLGRTYPVRRIDIWARFNFKHRVDPANITVDDQTCASTNNSQWNGYEKEVTCSSVMYGRRVRITRQGNDEPLNMCEMQIWVPMEVSDCQVGRYGSTCTSTCSANCGKGPGKNFCYKSNGKCYDGCVDGWWGEKCSSRCQTANCHKCDQSTGQVCSQCTPNSFLLLPDCTECQNGYYKTASGTCERCSSNCVAQSCNRQTGRCMNGCAAGWWGEKCSSPCQTANCHKCDQDKGVCSECTSVLLLPDCTNCTDGYYKRPPSTGCTRCTQNCKSGTICDKNTGHCLICPPGKQGNICDRDCNLGKYGQNCTETCGQCKSKSSPGYCHPVTGECAYGCLDGWQPPLCKKECDDGHYGPGCTGRCGQCKGAAACNKTNGHCAVCDPGWQFPLCNTECSDGWYGENCAKRCGSGCQEGVVCNKTSGHCRCSEGKQPPLCATDCQGRKYGQDCTASCGQCRGGQTCHPVTGRCSEGCQPGWTDPPSSSHNFCQSECPDGVYGDGCNQTCGNCQKRAECRHDTGECTGQCSEGFTGSHCVEAITGGDDHTATIVGVVVAAVIVIVIVILVVIIVMRRRKQTAKSSGLESSEMSNNSRNGGNPERFGASSLGFDPIVVKVDNPDTRPKVQVKPVVKAAVKSGADPNEGHVYENVSLSKQNTASKPTPAPPKQAGKKNDKGRNPPEKTAKPLSGAENSRTAIRQSMTDDEELDSMWSGEEAIYCNEPSTAKFEPPSIRLDQLQKTIVDSVKAGTVTEEFGHMVGLKEYPQTHGKRQENYYKNRFKTILPYDEHRVILEQVGGDDASDYINASFIKGHKTDKAYIASQGPRPNTQDDFWRMVLQEKVTDIVMLTNTKEANKSTLIVYLKEGNKDKCSEYWPAQGSSVNTGHVEVTCVEEVERAHFIIRTFNIRKLQGKEKRQVRQYHYVKWMDHEVPATTPLVDFWRYVRARAPRTATAPPLLVHCSAGVGRTGTYIALDILIDQSQHDQEVSIYNTVDNLRNYRCHMVQNKGQYEFLHEAFLEAYMGGDSRLKSLSFDNTFPVTIRHDQPHPRIDAEYKRLCQMKTSIIQPRYTIANLEENRQKNRNPGVLPDDKHLVFITEHTKGRNQYINAVYMPTFLSPRGSIVTQLPLADTVIDMWRLVDSWNVNTIISIGHVDGKAGLRCYWPKPKGQPVKCGAYTISFMSMTSLGDTLSSYTVEMKKEDNSRELRILHYEAWTGEVADNISDLINLLDTLQTAHKQSTKQPIIVQCIDGAAQSGALCALWDVISRVTYDDSVDVYMAVRHVHTVRPEAITSAVQYRFIYEVVQQYRNSSNIYANT